MSKREHDATIVGHRYGDTIDTGPSWLKVALIALAIMIAFGLACWGAYEWLKV